MLYYFGDEIFFNLCLLGKIEEYLKNNGNLQIKTLPKYAIILRMLFKNIHCIESNNLDNDDFSVFDFFKIRPNDQCKLNKSIIYEDDMLSKKYNFENVVCIKLINNDVLPVISNLVKDTFLFRNSHVVVINDKMDIQEIVFLLNKNLLLITDDINLLSLASNCPLKNIGLIVNTANAPFINNSNNKNFFVINLNDKSSFPKFRINFLNANNFIKKNLGTMRPFVSCICPTYNRQNFIPNLINLFRNQNYPSDSRELIILDDSPNDASELVKSLDKDKNIKYYHIESNKPLPIGKKRNLLHQYISGEYIICFDDDDYYPSTRISHAINKLTASNVKFAGSSKMHIYYTDIKKIYEFGPYGNNHATNGTFAYHRSYILRNFYEDDATFAEEKYFLNNYQEKLIQLDSEKTILCIAHGKNTFDKKKVLHMGKLSHYKLKNFIQDKKIIDFYKSL